MDMLQNFDEEADTEVTAPYAVTAPKNNEDLSSKLWNSFCYDLVLAEMKHEGVCKTYGIAEDVLLSLMENPKFCDRLKACKKEVAELGANAPFVLAARTEAAVHIQTLSGIAHHPAINPGVRVKAIESIVKFAGLDPSTDKTIANKNGSGVMVQFVIGGGLLGSKDSTINVTPIPQVST